MQLKANIEESEQLQMLLEAKIIESELIIQDLEAENQVLKQKLLLFQEAKQYWKRLTYSAASCRFCVQQVGLYT